MIGAAGPAVSITGLGCRVPDRVVLNDELAQYVDTSDEWIRERTGIRERRVAAPEEALSDLALPAAREALEEAGLEGRDIDLLIVATVTPDMAFPSTAAILADQLGTADAAAYDLASGCTGFMYAIAQAYGMLAGGLAQKALVVGGVVLNDELAQYVDTSDEWIRERTGIRERRVAAPEEALSDLALPAAREALEEAGLEGRDVDLLIVATVTPDMAFPSTAAILADQLGTADAAAYDLASGCTGFMYAIAQAYGMLAGGLAQKALVVGGDVLSRILDWSDRSTLVLFGDGAGAVVLESVPEGGFLGFELGADGAGGSSLWLPGSGSRLFEDPSRHVRMNGREVFRFATRILVQSAQAVLDRCGLEIDDVDVYVPHQANVRIIDHATKKLGVPSERVVINVDRYGNTSSGSIPLALADARADGRLRAGSLVLMTGMGAGLSWGSALMRWTKENGRL